LATATAAAACATIAKSKQYHVEACTAATAATATARGALEPYVALPTWGKKVAIGWGSASCTITTWCTITAIIAI
jgi:hypothetical protein